MIPTIGRIVHYRLSSQDAAAINRRRDHAASFLQTKTGGFHEGYQTHAGNSVNAGEVFPMLIVRTWGEDERAGVSGQVFLDGSDVFWATSRIEGGAPGQWTWPERVGVGASPAPPAPPAHPHPQQQDKPGRGDPGKKG
jgi:hypothetical protein